MKKLRLFIIFIIFLMMSLISSQAAFWHKDNDLGNDIQKEEYPDSRDVEPKKESDDSMVIQGSVENTVDISLEECNAETPNSSSTACTSSESSRTVRPFNSSTIAVTFSDAMIFTSEKCNFKIN